MSLDEIEDLIRRYLAAGITVVLVLVAPLTGQPAPGGDAEQSGSDPSVVTIEPTPTTTPSRSAPRTTAPPEDEHATGTGEPSGTPSTTEPTTTTAPTTTTVPDEDPPADSDDSTDTTDDPADEIEDRGPADGEEPDADAAEVRTAAERHGWGTPVREDDFTGDLDDWVVYEGTGFDGRGERSPDALTIEDGVLTVTGRSNGSTGGLCWRTGQLHGGWEGRVRAPESDPTYDALLLLWPDSDDPAVGGEIDFMEMQDPTRRRTDAFVHFGENDTQINGEVAVDGTQWHTWAVEWTPDSITAYLDGEQWFRTTDADAVPTGAMHLCIQLDWFPGDDTGDEVRESRMEVDWVRQYALPDDG